MEPSYISLYNNKELKKRAESLYNSLIKCEICPRKCRVNRFKEVGFCRSGINIKVSEINPHFGEEPVITGKKGSGTIFFSNCTMSCVYCQNFQISQEGLGKEISIEELAEGMIRLQRLGCHNINLVTPTHFIPQILMSLVIACEKGLNIPIVYNTNGYDLIDTLKVLDGIVDIYLPDIKYSDNEKAILYSKAKDYVEISRKAIKEMYRQVGNLLINNEGIAERGLIVRHLVLPEDIAGTSSSLKFLAEEISPKVAISMMSQYTPLYKAYKIPPLNRYITEKEYENATKFLEVFGLQNGWVQEFIDRNYLFVPNFKRKIVFKGNKFIENT